MVSLVCSAAQIILYRGEAAVGDDIVYLPAIGLQIGPGSLILCTLGSSAARQERWFIRYSAPLISNCFRFCRNFGLSGFRMPPEMSWLLAPLMAKNFFPLMS